MNTQSQTSKLARKADSAISSRENGVISSLNSFSVEEALDQVQGYVSTATDFAKKRPYLVLSVACAIGAIGAWAISQRGNKAVE